jgi:hypothetical protein
MSALCLYLAVSVPSALGSVIIFHARAHRSHLPSFVCHHHRGSAGSTPRRCPGHLCGGIGTPRSGCSIGHRVDHPGGKEECGVWIFPCIPASKPVPFDKCDRFPDIYEVPRRTTNREGLTRCCACTIIVRGEMGFAGCNRMTCCYLTLEHTPKNLQEQQCLRELRSLL